MDVKCIDGKIVITQPSGFVSRYSRSDYEEFIEREQRMLERIQTSIAEAERMLDLIDYGEISE